MAEMIRRATEIVSHFFLFKSGPVKINLLSATLSFIRDGATKTVAKYSNCISVADDMTGDRVWTET
jgi:hypothetical protein